MEGWIKLHRKFLEWEWFDIPEMVKLFIFLLLNSNFTDKTWRGIEIKRGQYLTGLKSLSEQTKISIQTLRTCLTKLEKTGEINSEVTNKYRIITICNYDSYQDNQQTNQQPTNNQLTINQQSTNNQLTTTKEGKESKESKEEEIKELIYNKFYDYEIKLSKNNSDYIRFVKILFGENFYSRPLNSVLKLKEQVSWEQFPKVIQLKNKHEVKISEKLEAIDKWLMENPNKKNSTLLGTLRTFCNPAKK